MQKHLHLKIVCYTTSDCYVLDSGEDSVDGMALEMHQNYMTNSQENSSTTTSSTTTSSATTSSSSHGYVIDVDTPQKNTAKVPSKHTKKIKQELPLPKLDTKFIHPLSIVPPLAAAKTLGYSITSNPWEPLVLPVDWEDLFELMGECVFFLISNVSSNSVLCLITDLTMTHDNTEYNLPCLDAKNGMVLTFSGLSKSDVVEMPAYLELNVSAWKSGDMELYVCFIVFLPFFLFFHFLHHLLVLLFSFL